jgi:WD40 repeat protein
VTAATGEGGEGWGDRVALAFARVRRLQGAEREARLAEECAGDEALEAEVRSLLDAVEGAPAPGASRALVDTNELRQGLARHAQDAVDELPARIGHYRIVRRIGEGGMGAVYEAEQDMPRRRVALKLVRPGHLTDSMRRRLVREVELLGRLHHPGIAQVHEAGLAEPEGGEGAAQPFFAMELVDGLPITEHADRRGLSTRERLDLFARLCDAVEHAHSKGVVHRDLKPQNILVDADGQPKVLDFGVARAIEGSEPGTLLTQAGQLVGTLPYMSPEQVAGRPDEIGHRSDIYALGVIAFELLARRLPHDLPAASLPEAIRRLREDEPMRLGAVDRALRGDVDTIVGKALEKDPARRYASAAELASDVRRFLASRPIAARPPSAAYQLTTFARRHRPLVAGAALAVTALVLAAAFASWQAFVATRARDEEQRLRELADASAGQARRQEQAALRQAYRASLVAALAALSDGDAAAAQRHLDVAPESLRGWEWRHVEAQLDESLARMETGLALPESLMVLDDGSIAAIGDVSAASLTIERFDPATRRRLTTDVVDRSANPVRIDPALLPVVRRRASFAAGQRELRVLDRATLAPLATLRRGGDLAQSVEVVASARPGGVECLAPTAREWLAPYPAWTCDVATGKDLAHLDVPEKVRLWAMTPDERWLAYAVGASMRVFDARSGAIEAQTPPGDDDVSATTFRPDGARLVAATANAAVWTWGLREHRVLATRRAHRAGQIGSLAISGDGQHLASGSDSGQIQLWDPRLAQAPLVLDGHAGPVLALAFAADGRELFSLGADRTVRAWDASTHDDVRILRGHASFVYPVATSRDGRLIASGSWDSTVRLWDALTGKAVATLEVPEGSPRGVVYAIAFSGDSGRIAAGTRYGHLLIWSIGGRLLAERQFDAELGLAQIGFDAQDRLLEIGLGPATADPRRERTELLDARTLELVRSLATGSSAGTFSPDGRRFAGATRAHCLEIADVATGVIDVQEVASPDTMRSLEWSPDGRRIAGAGLDGRLHAWDASGKPIGEWPAGTGRMLGVAWSPDGTRLATGGDDGIVRLWDASDFSMVAELRGHAAYVYSLAWTPDGRTLVSGSGDGTVRLWSTHPLREFLAP